MNKASEQAKKIKKGFSFGGEYDLGEVFQAMDDLIDEVEELEQWKSEFDELTTEIVMDDRLKDMTKKRDSYKATSDLSLITIKGLEEALKSEQEAGKELMASLARTIDRLEELAQSQAHDYKILEVENAELIKKHDNLVYKLDFAAKRDGLYMKQIAELKSLATTQKSMELAAIIKGHVEHGTKQLKEINDLKEKFEKFKSGAIELEDERNDLRYKVEDIQGKLDSVISLVKES